MARKYTILKVLTPNLTKGFTLIELIFGLLIMTIVGGLLMNTLIEASKSFNSDKKTIDSSQNLSAILEIIGNDIKQSGEQIKDSAFPAIELKQDSADGSTIIIRRALTSSMTLCENILANDSTTRTTITVGDTSLVGQAGCNPIQRDTSSLPAQPLTLREASNYRCQLGDPNAAYGNALDSCAIATASANNNPSLQNVLLAISDQAGRIRTFRYTGENITPALYKLQVASPNPAVLPANNNGYSAGSPIYTIEERQYTLDPNGNLTVAVDGKPPTTLISGIKRFKVSARAYKVTATGVTPAFVLSDKVIDPDAAGTGFTACTPGDGVSMPASTPTTADPKYACKINFTNPPVNWKQIAGVRVELESKYNAAGESATATQASLDKLTARAEYFPRNVLSK